MLSDHRYTAIFGAALLTASGATFAVYRMLGTAAKPQREPVRTVVVAVRDVPVGVPVPREALGLASWPVRVAPAESFVTADSVVGRVTRAALMPGEPVLSNRLATRGAAPGLEGAIDPARRAMAVRVNEAASVSGLVRANSRVDVLMAGRGDGAQTTARVLMTDVRVLGVGSVRPPDPSASGASSEAPPSATTASIITLEVTPAQAEQLAAAESQAAIQVVLRGYGSAGPLRGESDGVAAVLGAGPGAVGAPGGLLAVPPGAARFSVASARPSASAPQPSHAERHTPHPVRGRDVASDPPLRRVDDARTRPESTVVYVYRGGVMTTLRMPVTAPVPSAPAAVGVDAPRDGATPVRTADAQAGPRAP